MSRQFLHVPEDKFTPKPSRHSKHLPSSSLQYRQFYWEQEVELSLSISVARPTNTIKMRNNEGIGMNDIFLFSIN